MGDLAAVGPATALVGSLVLGLVAHYTGVVGIYFVLALVSAPAMFLGAELAGAPTGKRAPSRSRSNRLLLLALFLLTAAGSSLFLFEAVIAGRRGIAGWIVAIGFSLNAAAGMAGARLAGRVRRPGLWMTATGAGALATVLPGGTVLFVLGMAWWGFAFWMGVPGVLMLLAERSLEPGERAGDAQGWMAFGRSLGPLAGGWFVDASAYTGLAVAAATGLAVSGGIVRAVEWGRGRLPATDPRTVPHE